MGLSIGELSASAGLNASAVRYYESVGLLRKPGRRSGRRVYDSDAERELAFVARARSAGFRVAEIRKLVELVRSGDPASDFCADAKALAAEKVAELERQIMEATRLRDQLQAVIEVDCSGQDNCSVISG